MQHLNTLSQLVNAASTVVELTRSSQTYTFNVGSRVTCYLHVAGGEVRVTRRDAPVIDVTAQLQAPFAWRIAAEQDEAGVYFVALRRPIVGAMAGASFAVAVPTDAHLTLQLERTRLTLEAVDGVIDLPPQITTLQIAAKSS